MKSLLQQIGQYRIVEKLGRGGMADVYLAFDTTQERRVALKLVECGSDPDANEIVEAERLGAELQRQMSGADPRVPAIHAFGDLEGCFFIDMEYVEGSDLSTLIAAGPLAPERAARIAAELCSILRTAHGLSLRIGERELRAVVHGDIKPKNIRIDAEGKVRVLDFGIAKGLSITRRLTGNVFGSVAYSSPERLESGAIDEMSDLWAVGIVLYEMIEGMRPFEAASSETLETIIRSRSSLRPMTDACPIALQQIVYKALAGSPARRYPDASRFEVDLLAFLSGEATVASQEEEETRRTVPPDGDETRRVTRDMVDVAKGAPHAGGRLSRFALIASRIRHGVHRRRKWILATAIALCIGVTVWEGLAIRSASRVEAELIAGRLDGERAWEEYQNVESRSVLKVAPLLLHGSLKKVLCDRSERVMLEYRNSNSSRVREGDWLRCQRDLIRAARLDPGDPKLAAMLEYANGHILRINRKGMDAIAAFMHAAALQPKWADPYLGLARTYVYTLGDMERGTQALERARKLGHSFGKRELAMLAEAHRSTGMRARENARLVEGTDREKEFLKKAQNELNDALKTYFEISPWGDAEEKILGVQESLAEVENRMRALEQPNPMYPWNWFK